MWRVSLCVTDENVYRKLVDGVELLEFNDGVTIEIYAVGLGWFHNQTPMLVSFATAFAAFSIRATSSPWGEFAGQECIMSGLFTNSRTILQTRIKSR